MISNRGASTIRGLSKEASKQVYRPVLPFLYQTQTIGQIHDEGPKITKVLDRDERRPTKFRPPSRTRGVIRQYPIRPVQVDDEEHELSDKSHAPIRRVESNNDEHELSDKGPHKQDFIPFEGLVAPPSLVTGPTVTANEQKTFRRLMLLQESQAPPVRPQVTSPRVVQERQAESDLDLILDEAIKRIEAEMNGSSPMRYRGSNLPRLKRKSIKESEKERILSAIEQKESPSKKIKNSKSYLTHQHFSNQEIHLNKAETDHALWKFLKDRIVSPIAAMYAEPNDDPHRSETKKITRQSMKEYLSDKSGKDMPDEPKKAVLTKAEIKQIKEMRKQARERDNFPLLVRRAAALMRKKFPTSQFILAIIPELRRAGPEVFALGASGGLYNEVLIHLTQKEGDVAAVYELLRDMEASVIEPDWMTRLILIEFLKVQKDYQQHGAGFAIRAVWRTERMKSLLREIIQLTDRFKATLLAKKQEIDQSKAVPVAA